MQHATANTFDEIVQGSDKPVLVDFWADWCPPCKAMEPILEDLNSEGNVSVVKVDVDAEMQLTKSKDVSSMPTLILYVEGEEAGRHVGAVSKDKLLDFVNELI